MAKKLFCLIRFPRVALWAVPTSTIRYTSSLTLYHCDIAASDSILDASKPCLLRYWMMLGVTPKMTGPSSMRDIVHVVLSLETEPLNFAVSRLFFSNRLRSIVLIRQNVGRARLLHVRNPSGAYCKTGSEMSKCRVKRIYKRKCKRYDSHSRKVCTYVCMCTTECMCIECVGLGRI